MTRPYLSAIYCDDIRNEVGGKMSYMGVYNNDLLVASFPVSIPKFSVHATLTLPLGTVPESVRVYFMSGEETLTQVDVTRDQIVVPLNPDSDLLPDERKLALNFIFSFAPLLISKQTRLRLKATVDGSEYKGNSLKIRLPTESERASLVTLS
jgi:hypothetical protein